MPLTTVLRDADHPVTRWMRQNWPQWRDGWHEWTQVIEDAGAPVRPRRCHGYPWAMVGRAWQFGFALRWGLTSLEETTARFGVAAWAGWPPDPHHWVLQAWRRLQRAGDAWLAAAQSGDRFWSLCWTLAHWESAYRSGQPEPAIETAWRTQRPIAIPSVVQEDLTRITQRFDSVERVWRQKGLTVQLDPSMPDGDLLGGADGDAISDQTLWDFKVTVHPLDATWWRHALWQLIGYWLLDGEDAFGLRAVGLALPRQGVAWRVPVADLLSASGRDQSPEAWRAEFGAVAISAREG